MNAIEDFTGKQFSLLIKPSGADCNLSCHYCFYTDKSSLYPKIQTHRMSEETLEHLIKTYMATPQRQYAFAWQGGEPTLFGLDCYRRVVRLQKKYGPARANVANHLQTNATLIDDAFADFFSSSRFLVGVSLDGPQEIHDKYRTDNNGHGTHARVMHGLRVLRKHRVQTNILTLVSRANAVNGREVYAYLCAQGILHHQYIPCVEFDPSGRLQPYALTAQLWGEFLCQVFDAWWEEDVGRVSIRYFDSLLLYLASGQQNLCHIDRRCGQYFLVEHNGDIFPCDFFARPEMKIGNVLKETWNDLFASPQYTKFATSKHQWNTQCDACPYLDLCAGDCLKHRLNYGNGSSQTKSWLCEGYRRFFKHALPRLKKIARYIDSTGAENKSFQKRERSKTGRNQLCPCSSGKKFKKCCGHFGR